PGGRSPRAAIPRRRHGHQHLTLSRVRHRRQEQPHPPPVCEQPVVGSQDASEGSQLGSQRSVVVSSPSSQKASFGTFWQVPVSGSHESTVHGTPSSHVNGTFWHSPVATSQESVVHRLKSSHDFAAKEQKPVAWSHESTVQGLWSSQGVSIWHVGVHPSQKALLPSSHSSVPLTMPSPQTGTVVVVVVSVVVVVVSVAVVVGWGVVVVVRGVVVVVSDVAVVLLGVVVVGASVVVVVGAAVVVVGASVVVVVVATKSGHAAGATALLARNVLPSSFTMLPPKSPQNRTSPTAKITPTAPCGVPSRAYEPSPRPEIRSDRPSISRAVRTSPLRPLPFHASA